MHPCFAPLLWDPLLSPGRLAQPPVCPGPQAQSRRYASVFTATKRRNMENPAGSSGGRAAPQPTFASEAEVTRPVGGDPPCSEARPISRTRQVPGQRFRTSRLPRRGSGLNCAGCLCLPGVTRLITPAGRGLFQAPAWQHAETPACGFRSASGLGPPAALFLSGDTSDTPASSV